MYQWMDRDTMLKALILTKSLLAETFLAYNILQDKLINIQLYVNPKGHKQPAGYLHPVTNVEQATMDVEEVKKKKQLEDSLLNEQRKKAKLIKKINDAKDLLSDDFVNLHLQTDLLKESTETLKKIQEDIDAELQKMLTTNISKKNNLANNKDNANNPEEQQNKNDNETGNDTETSLGGIDNNDSGQEKKGEKLQTTVTSPVSTVTPLESDEPVALHTPMQQQKKATSPKHNTGRTNKSTNNTPAKSPNSPSSFFLNTPFGNELNDKHEGDEKVNTGEDNEEGDERTKEQQKDEENKPIDEAFNRLFNSNDEPTPSLFELEDTNIEEKTLKAKQTPVPKPNIKQTQSRTAALHPTIELDSDTFDYIDPVPPNTVFVLFLQTYSILINEIYNPEFTDAEGILISNEYKHYDIDQLRAILSGLMMLIEKKKENSLRYKDALEFIEKKAMRAYKLFETFDTVVGIGKEDEIRDEIFSIFYFISTAVIRVICSKYRKFVPQKYRDLGLPEWMATGVEKLFDSIYGTIVNNETEANRILHSYNAIRKCIIQATNIQAQHLYNETRKHFFNVIKELSKIYNHLVATYDTKDQKMYTVLVNLGNWIMNCRDIIDSNWSWALHYILEYVEPMLMKLLQTFPNISNYILEKDAVTMALPTNLSSNDDSNNMLIEDDDEKDIEVRKEKQFREEFALIKEQEEQRQGDKCSLSFEVSTSSVPTFSASMLLGISITRVEKTNKQQKAELTAKTKARKLLLKVFKLKPLLNTEEAIEKALFNIMFIAVHGGLPSKLSSLKLEEHCTASGASKELMDCLAKEKNKVNQTTNLWYIYLYLIHSAFLKEQTYIRENGGAICYLAQLFTNGDKDRAEQLLRKVKVGKLMLRYPGLFTQTVAVKDGADIITEKFEELLQQNSIPKLKYDPVELLLLMYKLVDKPKEGEECTIIDVEEKEIIEANGTVQSYYYDNDQKNIMVKVIVNEKEYHVRIEHIIKK